MSTKNNNYTGQSIRILALVVCTSLGACSWIPKGDTGMDVGIKEWGVASWYGPGFHGRQAANGEIFDMSALTAAHRTLPLGSIVRVVNLQNGRHVRVRINDRGPYVNGRILDLSYAAAARLGMVDGGITLVQLEVIGDHRPDTLFEEPNTATVSLIALRPLTQTTLVSSSSVDRPESSRGRQHRLHPNDVWIVRRWRSVPSNLGVDPTNGNVPALALA